MNRVRTLLGALLLCALATPLQAQTVAITNARIHTVSGPVIERGTVVIQNGRIAAVGANVTAPAGARVIDAAGMTVTPGFLDSSTSIGLAEIGSIDATNDASTDLDRMTAAFNVADGFNPLASPIAVTRIEGITRAVARPGAGAGILSGQGVLVQLGGNRASDMIVVNPIAMYADLGEGGAERSGGSRAAAMLLLREALRDARDYAQNRAAYDRAERREYALSRLDLEALQTVLNRELPLVVQVNRAADILAVLRLAREENIRVILSGAEEGWAVASDIAAAGVPVLLNSMQNIPGFDNLGATLENAARLNAAGVTIALSSFNGHNARNLKQVAGNAVSYGLPHEQALAAVTLVPARIFGVDDEYGSLEVGREADVVVWTGDPFEFSTDVAHVFIRGIEIPLTSRQELLFDRYRTLPPR